MSLERRFAAQEIRVDENKLVGLAVPFNSPARIGLMTEVVKPGAFSRTLQSGRDVRALVDHRSDQLLARVSNGGLRLEETQRGLEFSLDLPRTQLAADVRAMAEAELLSGMSIGFNARRPGADRVRGRNRELLDVDLLEISVITGGVPAFSNTHVSARSLRLAAADLAAFTRTAKAAAAILRRP